jgi:hypothetical protein
MITDEMLRSSAARSSELFAHTITSDYDPAQQYEPSDLFEKKIRKLFHRAKHPYFYKAIQRIASIFLAAILIGSMYLAVDTEARAAFLDWIKEVYEHSIVYRIMPSSAAKDLPHYELTWLPDGFGEPDIYENETVYSALYQNSSTGEIVIFDYYRLSSEVQAKLFTDQQPEHVLVNGIIADFYAASSDSESNNLLWIDTEAGVFCAIDSNLSKDVILHIAESIYLVTITN